MLGSKPPAVSMKLSSTNKGQRHIWPLQADSCLAHPSEGIRRSQVRGQERPGELGSMNNKRKLNSFHLLDPTANLHTIASALLFF